MLAALATGCAGSGAHLHAQALPGADPSVSRIERVYVEQRPGDERNIHEGIRTELQGVGLQADAGPGPAPAGYDAVVTYLDRYMWDMSMYCIQLTIYVRDAQTGFVIATGSSYRPSLVRKTPAGHARLIVQEIFGGRS
jgi:hypothetical protein